MGTQEYGMRNMRTMKLVDSEDGDIPEMIRVCLYCRRDVPPLGRGKDFCCRTCRRRYQKTRRDLRMLCEAAHDRIRYLIDARGAWREMSYEIEQALQIINREISVALADEE